MKKLLYILCLTTALSAPALADMWYNGGTLQKADVTAWLAATPENRLATSADFVAAMNGITDPAKVDDQNAFKTAASVMEGCIDKLAQKPDTPQNTLATTLVITCNKMATQSKSGLPE